ncbi:MAG: hypothetical protein Unbinned3849contig1000_43 [Prokaryotic dsDNA virus sp.]|nr:MAG: hypothetical protein Unbinned3849contig1000_43 [Prokaryotic dsDNA virus sp.]|tara:strand:+ start:68 stop:493 length:426 start_codon:yes stop_codon:yes gene_type:complete
MANPLYGSNKSDDALDHWVKTLNATKKADSPDQLQFQVFETVVPAEGTSDVTFTQTIDVVEVWGGYCEVSGANGDFEFDLGFTGATANFIDDVGAGKNGLYAVEADYLDNNEDVILTITSNASTSAIKVKIALLTVKPVTS